MAPNPSPLHDPSAEISFPQSKQPMDFEVTALVDVSLTINLTQPWSPEEKVGTVLERARQEAEKVLVRTVESWSNIRVRQISPVQIVGRPKEVK